MKRVTIEAFWGLLLVAGLACGVVIVLQPQLFSNHAQTIPIEYDPEPTGLTNIGTGDCKRISNTYCDGQRMYELYTWYKNQPGWWNSTGKLTPQRFLALMLMAEATGGDAQYLQSITRATSSQIWGSSAYHKPYCTTKDCEAGIFNFIGAYMQSAGIRYNTLTNNPSANTLNGLIDKGYADYFIANGLTLDKIANDTIYNPISTVYNNDLPTEWGTGGCGSACNILGLDWVRRALSEPDLQVNTIKRCGLYDVVQGSQAVVYTINQQYNWSLPDTPCDD